MVFVFVGICHFRFGKKKPLMPRDWPGEMALMESTNALRICPYYRGTNYRGGGEAPT